MKKVLCFGDSNVYGYIPKNGNRYDYETRWTGVLKNISAGKYKITEAGCNNRTCFSDNPEGDLYTGYKALHMHLNEEKFDCIILAVGINDLQTAYNVTLQEVGFGLHNLIGTVYKYNPNAKIIVVAPSVITEDILNSGFSTMFDKTSIEKSKELGKTYKEVAQTNECEFVNLDNYVKVSPLDGLHYGIEEHHKIAEVMIEALYRVFAKK